MYTATVNGVRASWVVRPNDTAIGVQNSGSSNNDSGVADVVIANEQKFRDQVRNRRLLQSAQQLQFGSWHSTINGVPVVAVIVNGNTRFG
jgi:D-tyrosyl-tRNA(Tyr) deacylase